MITLLPDVNVEGHVARLLIRMQGDSWRDLWEYLDGQCATFADVSLSNVDLDSTVWRCCQEKGLILLTNNRNDDGPDSLAATIRNCTTSTSLPVFTFGDADKILRSQEYAEKVIESLFDFLLRLDSLLGTGRHFLP